jgi:hypothetical protein
VAADAPISRSTTFLALTAVAHVALTAWVRRDARARDVDPSPWDALTLLTGVVGAVAYCRRRSD